MWIDVYDFDGTVFRGDTVFAFWFYCLRGRPALVRHLPRQLAALAMMACGRWDFARGKGAFLRFLRDVDLDGAVERFWADPKTLRRVAPWFAGRDPALPAVIATASPEVLIAPFAKKHGARLIGTRIDPKTGELTSPNCRGAEKVNRLREALPDFRIRAMCTDDPRADAPLLELAQQKYVVRRGEVKRMW